MTSAHDIMYYKLYTVYVICSLSGENFQNLIYRYKEQQWQKDAQN